MGETIGKISRALAVGVDRVRALARRKDGTAQNPGQVLQQHLTKFRKHWSGEKSHHPTLPYIGY